MEGAIDPWARSAAGGTYRQQLRCICEAYELDPTPHGRKFPKN